MAQRRCSAPSAATPSPAITTPTPECLPPRLVPSTPPSSTLLAQADALAKMTFELNLRAVSSQAERLERDVRELVQCTRTNTEFRRENEKRLSEMMREILSVKSLMSTVEGRQDTVKATVEEQQRLTMEVVDGFRKEMGELRGLIDGLSSQLDQLPTMEEAMNESQAQKAPFRMETRSMSRAADGRRVQMQPQTAQLPGGFAHLDTKARIREAVNSTRRWNREHKVTNLSDSQFIAKYLNKQLKRDPHLAVLIQRALQKRIRLRRNGRVGSRPNDIEEFCRDVCWQDVIDTALQLLVVNEERTGRVLERGTDIERAIELE